MNLPFFIDQPAATAHARGVVSARASRPAQDASRIEPAMPGLYCAVHAAMCLGLTENPAVAALCWTNFASRCSVID